MFCLLRTKSIDSYDRVITKIIKQHSKMTPAYIIFDYKPYIYNSIKKAFPNANLGGCLFNLSQIL
jgi:hypothetical protein